MKITTRIAIGLFLMAGLLAGALVYQLSVTEQLQRINREISLTNLEAARISVRLHQGVEAVREFAAKSWAMNDEGYRRQWAEWEEAVDDDLESLANVGLTGEEDAIRARIEADWMEYRRLAPQLRNDPLQLNDADRLLSEMRSWVDELIAVNEAAVVEQTGDSAEAGDRARIVAWAAAGTAFLLAALVSLLFYRSISGPLRHLTRGTRELALGRFDHRLGVHGPGELSGLAEDFNHMATRLDEIEVLKRDFVSHVSHELKTPLAAIQETVEVLLEQIPGPLTEKQVRLLELSRKSSGRLSRMISDLLELSRLEAGAGGYDPDRGDLAEIARSVIEEAEPLARELDVALSFEMQVRTGAAICDEDWMRTVVMNLVSNALKFSPTGGGIELALTETEEVPGSLHPRTLEGIRGETGPFLLLSVMDRGPGVPDEHKQGIFEKFHQVGRKERIGGQGVGLGLAIARRIVEAHCGAIWVEDRPRGGSAFQVLIPRTPSRWRDLVSEQLIAPVDQPVIGAAPAMGRASHRALLLVLLLAASAGCVPLAERAEPAEQPPPPILHVPPLPSLSSGPMERAAPGEVETRLHLAHSLLTRGSYQEAAWHYVRILEREDEPEAATEALWGLALVHLLPESSIRDESRARTLLRILQDRHPQTVAAVQARWITGLLEELETVQERAESQAELLGELEATLERLREIDLERRPSSAPTPRRPEPDTLNGAARPS